MTPFCCDANWKCLKGLIKTTSVSFSSLLRYGEVLAQKGSAVQGDWKPKSVVKEVVAQASSGNSIKNKNDPMFTAMEGRLSFCGGCKSKHRYASCTAVSFLQGSSCPIQFPKGLAPRGSPPIDSTFATSIYHLRPTSCYVFLATTHSFLLPCFHLLLILCFAQEWVVARNLLPTLFYSNFSTAHSNSNSMLCANELLATSYLLRSTYYLLLLHYVNFLPPISYSTSCLLPTF